MSSSSSVQLTFTLRTSPNCKTVHLIGNWDGYQGQLPLAKDSSSSKSGAWKGTFKFSSKVLQNGGRYWYYYIMDGYHVSHNPGEPSTTEPTTGRQLNILDVGSGSSSSSSKSSSSHSHRSHDSSSSSRSSSSHSSFSSRSGHSSGHSSSSSRSSSATSHSSSHTSYRSSSSGNSSRRSTSPPKGRPISPSRIAHPRPVHPSSTTQQRLQSHQYAKQVASLSKQLQKTKLRYGSDSGSGSEFEEDRILTSSSEDESSGDELDFHDSRPSLSLRTGSSSSASASRSDSRSSASSASSLCSCDRWGITRKGDRVRLDCGGSRCNSAPSSPDLSMPSLSPGGMSPLSPAGSFGFDYGSGDGYQVRSPGDVGAGYGYAGYAGCQGYGGQFGESVGYKGFENGMGCLSEDSESESDGEEWKVRVQQASRSGSGSGGSGRSGRSGRSGGSGSSGSRSGSGGKSSSSGSGKSGKSEGSGRRAAVVVRGSSRR